MKLLKPYDPGRRMLRARVCCHRQISSQVVWSGVESSVEYRLKQRVVHQGMFIKTTILIALGGENMR